MRLACSLVALSFGLCSVPAAHAQQAAVYLRATVATVDDPGGLLPPGTISVGTVLRGVYRFDTSTPDTNSLPTVGDYWHTASGYGLRVEACGVSFGTDPANTQFLMEMVNDHGSPPRDNYLLRSYRNQSSAPLFVDHIAWQLDDASATAINSTVLSSSPPVLASWQSIFGLTIEGCGPGSTDCFGAPSSFFIRAHVDAVLPTSPDIGNAYCFGDGSGTGCPCSNGTPSGLRAGCRNSTGSGGRLVTFGFASVGSDSLVLAGSCMTNSSALYFQGTAQQNGGMGAVFGDGLRCAGGTIIRLGIKTNAQSESQYPAVGDPPVSVKGLVPAGATRTYQVWFRDVAGVCSSSTFNLTNGVQVAWTL